MTAPAPTPSAALPAAPAPTAGLHWALATFRFFSSLKLAMILLLVLIVGLIGGTILETQRSAAVAKAHVYDAPWFSIWLAFLIINLTCAALIRYPWKPYLTGFVITHAGIITMLVGAKIGQITGVEGGIDLHTYAPPARILEKFDDQWIEIGLPDTGRIHKLPFSVAVDAPRPNRPVVYTVPADNLTVRVLDLMPVNAVTQWVPIGAGGADLPTRPAIRFAFRSRQMGQEIVEPLPLGESSTPGPIEFRFLRQPQKTRSMERFFFFQTRGMGMMKSGAQIGPDSGLNGTFAYTDNGGPENSTAALQLQFQGKTFDLALAGQEGKELPLAGTPYVLLVEKIFRNLHVGDGGAQDNPAGPARNPAVLVKLFGPLVDPATTPTASTGGAHGGGMPGAPKQPQNKLFFYLAPDGQLSYWAQSPKHGEQSGPLLLKTPLNLGWGDMQAEVLEFLPRVRPMLYFQPIPGADYNPDKSEGLRPGLLCEVEYNGAKQQVWIGRQRRDSIAPQTVLCNGKTVNLQLGAQTVDLGFEVHLQRFDVPHNEGTKEPADFKSTLEIGPPAGEGSKEVAQIFMNNPTNYPNTLAGSYLGTSYKFSQANHNPEDPTYSGVQVLRDPGWMPKWVGALMICFGIFTMFYLKPYFQGRRQELAARGLLDPEQQNAAAATAADILKRARAQAQPDSSNAL